MAITFINSPVSITAIGFGRNMRTYPKRMEWAGKTYQFVDQGICVTSRHGETVTNTLTMSDGNSSFCLRMTGSLWTLVSVC